MSPYQLNACNCNVQLSFIIERGAGGLALGWWWDKHQEKDGLVAVEANMTETVVTGTGMTWMVHSP
eukprot:11266317-Ditylum_brightwellii.AAC.1